MGKHPRNRGHRNKIENKKYRKRIKNYGVSYGEFRALKHHGKPCSCWMLDLQNINESMMMNRILLMLI
jgi:hypothetical protein